MFLVMPCEASGFEELQNAWTPLPPTFLVLMKALPGKSGFKESFTLCEISRHRSLDAQYLGPTFLPEASASSFSLRSCLHTSLLKRKDRKWTSGWRVCLIHLSTFDILLNIFSVSRRPGERGFQHVTCR